MDYESRAAYIALRERRYPPGRRIRALRFSTDNSAFDDNGTVPPGTEGTVTFVDGAGTVFADWDNGSSIGALIEDEIEVVE